MVYTQSRWLDTEEGSRIMRLFTRLCTTALQNDDLEMVMADIGTTYLNAKCSAQFIPHSSGFLSGKGAGPRGTTSARTTQRQMRTLNYAC
jgi:hypothetical protein